MLVMVVASCHLLLSPTRHTFDRDDKVRVVVVFGGCRHDAAVLSLSGRLTYAAAAAT